MQINKRFYLILLILVFIFPVINAQEKNDNLIQMAILLDTSGSMEGLIEQAKTQLWKIVNELALSKKYGRTPRLEVALYEYGKDSIPEENGFLRMLVPLTTDLDKISDELFKLKTNGGSEYCGEVIQHAARNLKWDKSNRIYKVIFIAGNEPFTQGKVKYQKSCKESISKGIIVNTIFCGPEQEGIDTRWKDGADLADGKYMNIDHNQQTVYIEAPQDKEIMKLNEQLNKTYIAYGNLGAEKKRMQQVQDSNAAKSNKEATIQRAFTKSSKLYKNEAWDLLDAVENEEVAIEEMETSQLPEEMKKMSKEERKKYVEKMQKQRKEIQEKIKILYQQRNKYIEAKRKESAEESTLESAIINVIHEQATDKNFIFK